MLTLPKASFLCSPPPCVKILPTTFFTSRKISKPPTFLKHALVIEPKQKLNYAGDPAPPRRPPPPAHPTHRRRRSDESLASTLTSHLTTNKEEQGGGSFLADLLSKVGGVFLFLFIACRSGRGSSWGEGARRGGEAFQLGDEAERVGGLIQTSLDRYAYTSGDGAYATTDLYCHNTGTLAHYEPLRGVHILCPLLIPQVAARVAADLDDPPLDPTPAPPTDHPPPTKRGTNSSPQPIYDHLDTLSIVCCSCLQCTPLPPLIWFCSETVIL